MPYVLAVVLALTVFVGADNQQTSPDTLGAARSAAHAYLLKNLAPSRYMSGYSAKCSANPIKDWPNYEKRAVARCKYTVTHDGGTLVAIVYLLNPSEENIVQRIANACASLQLEQSAKCGKGLARMIVEQNGGQFPVAGMVIERKKDAGGKGEGLVYLEFRDGTTVVTTDRLNFHEQQLSDDRMEHSARAPIIQTRTFARIADATRQDYFRAGGSADVGACPREDSKNLWPSVIRENELRAQDTGVDELLKGKAMGMRAELF